jgi:hypothetical protein
VRAVAVGSIPGRVRELRALGCGNSPFRVAALQGPDASLRALGGRVVLRQLVTCPFATMSVGFDGAFRPASMLTAYPE